MVKEKKTLCTITFPECGCKYKEYLTQERIDDFKERGIKIRRIKKWENHSL